MTNSPTIISVSPSLTRRWYTVADVAAVLQFGRSKTKMLIATGAVRSVKVGGNRRVLPEWVDEYVAAVVERGQR
jgi:excisionase family DNA binding protein